MCIPFTPIHAMCPKAENESTRCSAGALQGNPRVHVNEINGLWKRGLTKVANNLAYVKEALKPRHISAKFGMPRKLKATLAFSRHLWYGLGNYGGMMMVKIEIDGTEYEVEIEVFRRLVKTTQTSLERIKKEEGGTFPKVDKKALDFTFELQFKHTKLI